MTFWHLNSFIMWRANFVFVMVCDKSTLSSDIQNSEEDSIPNVSIPHLFLSLWTQGVSLNNYYHLDTSSIHFILLISLLSIYYVLGTVWHIIQNWTMTTKHNSHPHGVYICINQTHIKLWRCSMLSRGMCSYDNVESGSYSVTEIKECFPEDVMNEPKLKDK